MITALGSNAHTHTFWDGLVVDFSTRIKHLLIVKQTTLHLNVFGSIASGRERAFKPPQTGQCSCVCVCVAMRRQTHTHSHKTNTCRNSSKIYYIETVRACVCVPLHCATGAVGHVFGQAWPRHASAGTVAHTHSDTHARARALTRTRTNRRQFRLIEKPLRYLNASKTLAYHVLCYLAGNRLIPMRLVFNSSCSQDHSDSHYTCLRHLFCTINAFDTTSSDKFPGTR